MVASLPVVLFPCVALQQMFTTTLHDSLGDVISIQNKSPGKHISATNVSEVLFTPEAFAVIFIAIFGRRLNAKK